ncbi:10944_t:CDS:2 [Acaulospora morrowiae]|uniref:10944_t:CDS:1 n=1 Tax=Acaulospora morrowiae TaxID=94023 RepID=A0A9N8V6R2_9GLOM|nr:10944_t:CDS:2 [Acaulospora morrowiae]
MEFTNRLPSELFIQIFKNLDVKSLCTLAKVSRGLNALSSDNHVWSVLALERWENKQGMKDICYWKGITDCNQNDNSTRYNTQENANDNNIRSSSESQDDDTNSHLKGFELWFSRPGIWKRVYAFVETEAKRCRWDVEDLIENVWSFKFNSYPIPYEQSPKFHRNGIYTHEGIMNARFPYVFTQEGHIRVDQFPPLITERDRSTWAFKMKNTNVTFESLSTQSFKRKLKEFERSLLIEFGIVDSGNGDHYRAEEGSDSRNFNNFSDDDFQEKQLYETEPWWY